MSPQDVIDGVWTATGVTVSAAFIGVIFGLIQAWVPNTILDTSNVGVRNAVLAILCAALVALASYQLGQQGVQPSIANGIGAVIAYAGLFRLSVSLHSDAVQTVTGTRPPSLLGPDTGGGG